MKKLVKKCAKYSMSKQAKDLFSKGGENYAKYRPVYPKEMYTTIMSHLEQKSRMVALDIACGTGEATRGLLPYFDTIIATDVSQSQISNAFQDSKIHYKVAPCDQSGLEDGSVDLITVAQALHWFEYDKFFKELDRVLKPSGVLAVIGYPLNYFDNTKASDITKHYFDVVLDQYWHPRRKVLDNLYKEISFPYTVERRIFQYVKEMTIENYINYIKTWSAVITYQEKNGNLDFLIQFEKELQDAFGKRSDEPINVIYDMILITCQKSK
jgi:ubiquinone/menaquinone biosynthesis C-methylase UbiE